MTGRPYRNLENLRFLRLTVLKRKEKNKNGKILPRIHWLCLCDCGKEKIVQSSHLLNGNTTSCGCYRHEKTMERTRERNKKYFGKSAKRTVLKTYKISAKKSVFHLILRLRNF